MTKLTSSLNTDKLFGYNHEFNELKNSFDNNNFPSRVLLYGKKGIGKCTFAIHLINYFFSKNEKDKYNLNERKININNKSHSLVINNSHPNLFMIDLNENMSNIDISQIREMLKFSTKSSFNNNIKIVLINNADKLNLNSANAILKILEEPNENLSFILIHDSKCKILETIKSRCITYKFSINNDTKNNIINHFLKDEFSTNDFVNYYSSPGEIIDFYNFCKENQISFKDINIENFLKVIIENNKIKNNKYFINNISSFFEIYFYKKILNNKDNYNYFNLYNLFLKKINLFKNYNLDLESLLIEFKAKI